MQQKDKQKVCSIKFVVQIWHEFITKYMVYPTNMEIENAANNGEKK